MSTYLFNEHDQRCTQQRIFINWRKEQEQALSLRLWVADGTEVRFRAEKLAKFWASKATRACITAKLGLARALRSDISWTAVSWPARRRALVSSISDVLSPVAAVNNSWRRHITNISNGKQQIRTQGPSVNPFMPTVTIWVQLDRVKPSFVIFYIRALCCSGLSIRVPGCQKLQMTAYPGLAL